MKYYWLELEQFIQDQMTKDTHDNVYKSYGLMVVKAKMDELKSEFYYQSLKEAGYFYNGHKIPSNTNIIEVIEDKE